MPNAFTHGYALLVGVGESAYPAWSLPVTVKDVQAIRAILTDPNLCAYPDDDRHIRLIHDETATRAAILDGLAWLTAQAAADPDAIAVVFYSGHGWLDESTGLYYLIPHDVEPFGVAASALPAQEFTDALREIKAKRLLVMIDCCHAEGMATAKKGPAAIKLPVGLVQTAPPKGLVEQLKQGEGRAVFTSSRGQQLSWIRPDGSLSIYTHHLIESLQGAGNKPGDTFVHLSNLMNHLGKAVPESARTLYQEEQVPFFDTATEDFAVAMLRGGKGLPQEGWEGVKQEAAETIRHVVNVLASGERAVAIGGNVSGGTIITGDQMERRSSSQRPAWGSRLMSPPPVHVFISSTWLDMKPEREAVEAVLQRMRETKFAGMEYFGSRDEDARGTSLIEVDRSHVYVGIFGGRYGSGITEAEYRRARELKLPCFIYIKDEACVSPDKQEADAHKSRRLADLKGELRKNHIISTFSNPDDLAAKVTADLHRWLFDAYLAPRLEKAARGQSPREDAQVLLAAIKDPSALDPGLLDRLQKSGFVLAQGSGGVAIGGPVSGTTITTVGTQLNYYQPQDPSRATGPGGGVIQFGSGNKIGTISFGDVAGRDIVKTTTTATAPIQGNQELLALIDQLRADVAKLEGAPKGKRQDADDELRKAKEAAQEGARPSLLEKLEGAQKILLSLGGSITAAPQLADAVGTLLQRAMGLRS